MMKKIADLEKAVHFEINGNLLYYTPKNSIV